MPKKDQKDAFAIGRRKTSVAQVRLVKENTDKLINGKALDEYFDTVSTRMAALSPLDLTSTVEEYGMVVKVNGGGKQSQADAVRHGAARALLKVNIDWRKQLKSAGFLTRDPRAKERKKYGLKRARRAPQFSKR